ncbi:MAG TPA: glycosyltransferase, partial [Terriglobales bacterium]|nr:glycosyltransferase [Terriglobales bacterium]
MNIVVTSHQFLPEFSSGTELIAYNIAVELQSRGHAVTVVSAKPCDSDKLPTPRVDHYEHDGLSVYRFWHANDIHEGQTHAMESEYNHRGFYRWFRGFLETRRPDLVHFIHLNRLSGAAIDACTE